MMEHAGDPELHREAVTPESDMASAEDRRLVAVIGGLVAAIIGAAAWTEVAFYLELDASRMAWIVGALVAVVMTRLTKERSAKLGRWAVAITVGGLLFGNFLLAVGDQRALARQIVNDEAYLTELVFWRMFFANEWSSDINDELNAVHAREDDIPDALWEAMRAEAAATLSEMTDAQRRELAEAEAAAQVDAQTPEARQISLSTWDLLWWSLPLVTGFGLVAAPGLLTRRRRAQPFQRFRDISGSPEAPYDGDDVRAFTFVSLHDLVEGRALYWLSLLGSAALAGIGILGWGGPVLDSVNPTYSNVLLDTVVITTIVSPLFYGFHQLLSQAKPQTISTLWFLSILVVAGSGTYAVFHWIIQGWSWGALYVLFLSGAFALVLRAAVGLCGSFPILGIDEPHNFLRQRKGGRPGIYSSGRYVSTTLWLLAAGGLWVIGAVVATVTRLGLQRVGIPFSVDITRVFSRPIFSGASAAAWRRRRYSSPAARELMARDSRPPILLLRSFEDDNLGSEETRLWYQDATKFEEVVTDQLWSWGPVIAIGRPGESLPPAGAAREYVTNEAWQTRVETLAQEAGAVVIILGSTPGLAWELTTLARAGFLEKTVILVPPVDEEGYIARFRSAVLADETGGLKDLLTLEPPSGALAILMGADSLVAVVAPNRSRPQYQEILRVVMLRLLARGNALARRTTGAASRKHLLVPSQGPEAC